MDARQWDPYRRLLPGLEVVAVDLPGHGSRVGEPFTTDAAVDVIADAVEGVARGRRVVLVGHSLGGYMATVYAARRPGHLAGLVLVGATADPASRLSGVYRGFARVLPRVGAERMARVANGLMRWLGARGEIVAALPGGEAYAALPDAWQAVMEDCGPGLLGDVDCPVLLVNGGLDQMRVHVRRYAEAAREARVVTVPHATHLLPLTHPDALAALLLEAAAPGSGAGPLPTMDR
ncbi:alpha/beta fold hydrolase [Ornithinimicrobium avium]|uniref:Alpha/beta fold hydrolase n=2 Tax=Ornithinimicrobium avium TaxID=2283195 RepID=A0A345NT40_9MICO|nr:alpha/beta fold hydrolase [Ornithinimicrobium avium]